MFYVVRGLSPYTEYEFYVIAMNNIGRGPPSAPATTTTGETGKNNRTSMPSHRNDGTDSRKRVKLRTEIKLLGFNGNFILNFCFIFLIVYNVWHMNERNMASRSSVFFVLPLCYMHHRTFMQTKSMSESGDCR